MWHVLCALNVGMVSVFEMFDSIVLSVENDGCLYCFVSMFVPNSEVHSSP